METISAFERNQFIEFNRDEKAEEKIELPPIDYVHDENFFEYILAA